jgi:predicted cobalt transporter CbtA
MVTRRWRRRAVALAASVLLAGQAFLGTSGAMAAPVPGAADRAAPVPAASATVIAARGGQPHHQQQQLPEAGFDGILVAAIGTGLTGAGWLLMLTGSRRLRRRSR